MDKDSFLSDLGYALGERISAEEKAEILSYYNAYFAQGIKLGYSENELGAKLGNPDVLAVELQTEQNENAHDAAHFSQRCIAWFILSSCLLILLIFFGFLSGIYTRVLVFYPIFMLLCSIAAVFLADIGTMIKYLSLRSRKAANISMQSKLAFCVLAVCLAVICYMYISLCLSSPRALSLPALAKLYSQLLRGVYCVCAAELIFLILYAKKISLYFTDLYFVLIGAMCTGDSLSLIFTHAQNTADIRMALLAAALPLTLGIITAVLWHSVLKRRVQKAVQLLY